MLPRRAAGAGVRPGRQPGAALGRPGSGLRVARVEPWHLRRPQGQCLDRRQRREGRAGAEVHQGRQVPAAGGQIRQQQRQQRPGELRPRGEDLRRPEDQRGVRRRRLPEQARRRARRRHRQDEALLGRLRQQARRQQPRALQARRAAGAAVPQPGALLRRLERRPGVRLRPAERSPAGVHEGRQVHQGAVGCEAQPERRLGLGRRLLARSAAALPLHGRRPQPESAHHRARDAGGADQLRRRRPPARPVLRRAQHRHRLERQPLHDRDLRGQAPAEIRLQRRRPGAPRQPGRALAALGLARRQRMFHFARNFALAMLVLPGGLASAFAADYPTHPVKWIVPYPPGGTTDVLARIVSQWLSDKMGQTFIVENKPGGGNNIGVEYVVHSAPDGYTMLLVNPANGINATLYKDLPFNFIRDIAPVAGLIRTPNVMEVTNSLPAKTVAEFIAYCKANPGKINMASSSSGTSVHLSGELFKSMTGCDMLHVPFKGAGPALAELIAGNVHVIFDNLPSSIGHIKGGRIRALAVTSAEREPSLPGLPTVAETVPGYEASAWFGIGMPKGTPAEIIEKVNAETNRALADPKLLARLAALGGKPIKGTPQDFGKVIAAETAKWAKVVISSGAKVE